MFEVFKSTWKAGKTLCLLFKAAWSYNGTYDEIYYCSNDDCDEEILSLEKYKQNKSFYLKKSMKSKMLIVIICTFFLIIDF